MLTCARTCYTCFVTILYTPHTTPASHLTTCFTPCGMQQNTVGIVFRELIHSRPGASLSLSSHNSPHFPSSSVSCSRLFLSQSVACNAHNALLPLLSYGESVPKLGRAGTGQSFRNRYPSTFALHQRSLSRIFERFFCKFSPAFHCSTSTEQLFAVIARSSVTYVFISPTLCIQVKPARIWMHPLLAMTQTRAHLTSWACPVLPHWHRPHHLAHLFTQTYCTPMTPFCAIHTRLPYLSAII